MPSSLPTTSSHRLRYPRIYNQQHQQNMEFTSRHELQAHLMETGSDRWDLPDGTFIRAHGPTPDDDDLMTRPWIVCHHRPGGSCIGMHSIAYHHAGMLVWKVWKKHIASKRLHEADSTDGQ